MSIKHTVSIRQNGIELIFSIAQLNEADKSTNDISYHIGIISDGNTNMLDLTRDDFCRLYNFLDTYPFLKDSSIERTGAYCRTQESEQEILSLLRQINKSDAKEVREIICKTGALQKVVSGASTPLCVDNGEVLGLYYLKNGIVYYMPDINEQEHIVPTTGLLSCVTEYKLISKNQIVYKTSSGKLYYSYLNDTEWVSGAVILDDYSAQINYFSAAYDGYDINIVTLNTVDDKYCLKASSYTVLNDLAIEDVIVPYAFSISEPNEITIILHNKGTYPISEFEVLIDGLVCDYVVLLKPILPSQMYSFEYTLVLNDLVPITISIQTPYMEDANSDNNIFRIDTRICEIAITSINKEGVKLFYTIKNYSDFDVDILITFRLLNMTDSPELRSSINITKGATIVVEVNLQEFNIVQTGCIDVCVMADILSDEKLLYPVSSSYETQINLGMVAETNQYIDILNKTKRYL